MRVLLDECVPRKLRRELREHGVLTVAETGWAGLKNGALLRLAESQFDVFLTVDQNVRNQQNLADTSLIVLVLISPSNEIGELGKLMPRVRDLLQSSPTSGVHEIEDPG